jgi:hypothetical protein
MKSSLRWHYWFWHLNQEEYHKKQNAIKNCMHTYTLELTFYDVEIHYYLCLLRFFVVYTI